MSPLQSAGPVSGPHVLIADGSADMRMYIEGCLHALAPMRVVQAADGRAALQLARAIQPSIIIVERTLPGLNSRALYRVLHADSRTCDIPVLIISSEERPPQAAGDGFLVKPFNAARLQVEVERLLGRPLAPQPLHP